MATTDPAESAAPYEVRCPLHGSIPFSEAERRLIDHPLVQRLRAISQLGFAHLVYPGATHSRFSHALGVMHLAGRIFDHIQARSGDLLESRIGTERLAYCRRVLRFAGLLHDVGHLPFSHAAERLLPPLERLELPGDWFREPLATSRQAGHEDVSVAAVYALSREAPELLDGETARDVAALIHAGVAPGPRLSGGTGGASGDAPYPLLKQIVSGEIDADRMDYLPRDAHYCGVAYGFFDLERLISGLSCTETAQGLTLVLDQDAVFTYENFLMARFHMAMQVYFHKTLLPFDHYLARAVADGEVPAPFDGSIASLLDAREDRLMADLHAARERPWAARLVHRLPAARLYRFDEADPPSRREALLGALATAGIETIHIQEQRRVSSMNGGEGGLPPILVRESVLGRPRFVRLDQASQLLRHYNRTFLIERLYCDPADYLRAREVLREVVDGE